MLMLNKWLAAVISIWVAYVNVHNTCVGLPLRHAF